MSADLILDVMKAASTSRRQVAELKLAAKSARVDDSGDYQKIVQQFALVGHQSGSIGTALPEPDSGKAVQKLAQNSGMSVTSKSKPHHRAMIALEGSLMTNILDAMLPKGKSSVYGQGTAGEVWRGFQVDQMANSMAQGDVLRLAASSDSADSGSKSVAPPVAQSGGWPYFKTNKITSFAG